MTTGAVAMLAVSAITPVTALGASYEPGADAYSMFNATTTMGARSWWADGYTGRGVDVAIIDTGVSPVEGLDGRDKVIYGPDLSFESQAPNLTNLDAFGHGTFMAGLIAGNDVPEAGANPGPSAYRGVAPDARIVSLKVATADGGTDVSQVIAAIDWVVQHKNDNDLNIRVLNLSYGTNSLQKATKDPLAYAAEQAWKHGIVVVVAAGNTGYQHERKAPGLANPAYDPFVIGVGGFDTMGTASASDDVVGDYSASSCGAKNGCKDPDFVAIGSHLQGLRVPGSWIDQNHPEGVVNDRYFRGTGTSQATAITSGTVALLLQKYPSMTPDEVKAFIATNSRALPGVGTEVQGAGEVDLDAMAGNRPFAATQTFKAARGNGSLDDARGLDRISMDGIELTGEIDIFGQPFNARHMAGLEAEGRSWTDGSWNGSEWTGRSWTGRSWTGISWTGRSWTGRSWTTATWSDNSWDGRSWTGRSWTGISWSGRSWTGRSWTTEFWS
jgi:serine protease AprX